MAFSVRLVASHHLPQAPTPPLGMPKPLLGPQGHARAPGLPRLPVVPRKGKLCHEAQGWPLAHGGAGKQCSPGRSGEILVYNIKTSLTLTFLWTKAFTLETPSVFLPIILITEHVIPLLLFFCLHLICHQGAVFFAPLAAVPLPALAISGKHTQAHMAFTVGHPSKQGKKNKIKKSQV